MIAQALAHGSIAWWPVDIYALLLRRQLQLWVVRCGAETRACGVTRIEDYPRARVCGMLLVAGKEMDSWLHFDKDIEAWAREQGCTAMEGPGRRGWERVAAPLGWQPVWTVYRKMLDG